MPSVEWTLIDQARNAPIAKGDRVSIEAGGLPVYEVLEITDGRAWLRDERSHDHLLPTSALRWKLKPL